MWEPPTRNGGQTSTGDRLTMLGLILTVVVLFFSYLGVAAGVKWWPFDQASGRQSTARQPATLSSPTLTSPSSPSPLISSPSSSPAYVSVGATFLNVSWAKAPDPSYYVYTLKIQIFGLRGQTCVISWRTVDGSGNYAGTSGKITTGSLLYDDNIRTQIIDVTAPAGAWRKMSWSTEFTIYAPNGVQMASYG